jgi:hypothetical protein
MKKYAAHRMAKKLKGNYVEPFFSMKRLSSVRMEPAKTTTL